MKCTTGSGGGIK